jgi:glycosyltransferase involved in cell wall biosynthesis
MKVLQIINSLNTGGAEKLVATSLPLFINKGISVDLLTISSNKTALRKELEKDYHGSLFDLTSGSLYNPLLIFKIIPYLKNYDLIHAHLFPTLYWVVLAKWFSFSKVKIVYTEHSTYNRRRSSPIFKILDKFIYKKLDAIVAISDAVGNNLKEHLGFSKFSFHIIANGVDINLINSAKPYPKDTFFNANDFLLIQVSSFRKPKDQNTVIRALLGLPENIKLILVGEGGLVEESKNLVAELKLNQRVLFLGNRSDIPRLLKTADIVLLSSEYEGLSLSSIEGMAASKPFIASDAPGLREVVFNYGLLFETGNNEELAKKIARLYNNEVEYKEISLKCFDRSKNFDIDEMVNKYIQLYKRIVNA